MFLSMKELPCELREFLKLTDSSQAFTESKEAELDVCSWEHRDRTNRKPSQPHPAGSHSNFPALLIP